MNEVENNACGCNLCPGSSCTCGCRAAQPHRQRAPAARNAAAASGARAVLGRRLGSGQRSAAARVLPRWPLHSASNAHGPAPHASAAT